MLNVFVKWKRKTRARFFTKLLHEAPEKLEWFFQFIRVTRTLCIRYAIALCAAVVVGIVVLIATCFRRLRQNSDSGSGQGQEQDSGQDTQGRDARRQRDETVTRQRQRQRQQGRQASLPTTSTIGSEDWKLRVKLRQFNGYTEDPCSWMSHAKKVLRLSGLENASDRMKMEILSTAFTGNVEAWSEQIFGSSETLTFEDFEQLLQQRFRPAGFDTSVRTALQTLKQQRKESVAEYGERYMELTSLASVDQDQYLAVFINGLRSELRRLVVFDAPASFQDALDSSGRAELAVEPENAVLKLRTGTCARLRPKPATETQLAAADVRTNDGHRIRSRGNNDETHANRGLGSRERRILRTSSRDVSEAIPNRSAGRRMSDERYQRQIVCWNCGRQGHLRRNCPALLAENRGRNGTRPSSVREHPTRQVENPITSEESRMASLIGNSEEVAAENDPITVFVNEVGTTSVMIDAGSSKSFIDLAVARQAGCVVDYLKDIWIEGVNGLRDKAVGLTERVLIDISGLRLNLSLVVVHARGTFQLLLGRDFLHTVSAHMDFSELGGGVYELGGSVKVIQIEKRLHNARPQQEPIEQWYLEHPISGGDDVVIMGSDTDLDSDTAVPDAPVTNLRGRFWDVFLRNAIADESMLDDDTDGSMIESVKSENPRQNALFGNEMDDGSSYSDDADNDDGDSMDRSSDGSVSDVTIQQPIGYSRNRVNLSRSRELSEDASDEDVDDSESIYASDLESEYSDVSYDEISDSDTRSEPSLLSESLDDFYSALSDGDDDYFSVDELFPDVGEPRENEIYARDGSQEVEPDNAQEAPQAEAPAEGMSRQREESGMWSYAFGVAQRSARWASQRFSRSRWAWPLNFRVEQREGEQHADAEVPEQRPDISRSGSSDSESDVESVADTDDLDLLPPQEDAESNPEEMSEDEEIEQEIDEEAEDVEDLQSQREQRDSEVDDDVDDHGQEFDDVDVGQQLEVDSDVSSSGEDEDFISIEEDVGENGDALNVAADVGGNPSAESSDEEVVRENEHAIDIAANVRDNDDERRIEEVEAAVPVDELEDIHEYLVVENQIRMINSQGPEDIGPEDISPQARGQQLNHDVVVVNADVNADTAAESSGHSATGNSDSSNDVADEAVSEDGEFSEAIIMFAVPEEMRIHSAAWEKQPAQTIQESTVSNESIRGFRVHCFQANQICEMDEVSNRDQEVKVLTPQGQQLQSSSTQTQTSGGSEELTLEDVRVNPNLTNRQQQQVREVLAEFSDVFSTSTEISCHPATDLIEHEIILVPGASPFRVRRLKRLSVREREFVQEEIQKLELAGYISPHDGPWNANVSVAVKKNGNLRLCVAFLGLNARTVKHNFPLPNIEDLLRTAAGHSYYTVLDCQSAFHSVALKPEHRPYTQFSTPDGSWKWNRMPFGLKNAPATFARLISMVLKPTLGKSAIAFIDDALIFSDTWQQHLEDLAENLRCIRLAKLKLNPKKAEIAFPAVKFLGHQVSEQGIHVTPDKVAVIRQWPTPQNQSQLRSFLGLTGFYRRFIESYADITEPLIKLLRSKENNEWKWDDEQCQAFEALKTKLTESPVLRKPDVTIPFELHCDASGTAVGAVLAQDGRPVGFFSRTLNATERRYSATDREALSVVSAFSYYRHLLHGSICRCVTRAFTDHQAVVKILTGQEMDNRGRRARWCDTLSEFDFTLEHQPGSLNVVADALSRIPNVNERAFDEEGPEHEQPAIRAMLSDVSTDPELSAIKHYLQTGNATGDSWQKRRSLKLRARKFSMIHDVLMREDTDGILKVCVPRQDIPTILEEYHNEQHWGRTLTLQAIRAVYWWATMRKDIYDHIKSCPVCQSFGPEVKTTALEPLLASQPMEILMLDYLGPYRTTQNSNRFMISATCALTRWIEAKPTKDSTTSTALQFLSESVFSRFGLPVAIMTDRAQCFELGTTSSTIGLEERSHGILKDKIKALIRENAEPGDEGEREKIWDRYLPRAILAVNTRTSPTIPISPMECLLGIDVRKPTQLALIAQIQKHNNQTVEERIQQAMAIARSPELTKKRLLMLGAIRDECAKNKIMTANNMKRRHERKLRVSLREDIEVGDPVRVREQGRIGALKPRWRGPATVTWTSDDVFGVILGGQELTVHRDRICKWY